MHRLPQASVTAIIRSFRSPCADMKVHPQPHKMTLRGLQNSLKRLFSFGQVSGIRLSEGGKDHNVNSHHLQHFGFY